MLVTLTLSSDSRTTAGILLLTILAVEYGGLTVLRIVRGHQPAAEFQKAFARALLVGGAGDRALLVRGARAAFREIYYRRRCVPGP